MTARVAVLWEPTPVGDFGVAPIHTIAHGVGCYEDKNHILYRCDFLRPCLTANLTANACCRAIGLLIQKKPI